MGHNYFPKLGNQQEAAPSQKNVMAELGIRLRLELLKPPK
jgi:hypothetical protein